MRAAAFTRPPAEALALEAGPATAAVMPALFTRH